jgi:hypothetical protein
MDELISLLGGSLPLLLFLFSIVLYFQNRPEKPKEDPTVKEPLRWNESSMQIIVSTERLVSLIVEIYSICNLKGLHPIFSAKKGGRDALLFFHHRLGNLS